MQAWKESVIDDIAPEWNVHRLGQLVCPCGHRVEDDGVCPNGHESPLRQRGMV